MCVYVSSVVSKRTVSLYRASLALHWLSALHITMCWLPALNIALRWLPVALQRLPQLGSSSQELQIGSLQPLHRLPTLAPYIRFKVQTSTPEVLGLPRGVPVRCFQYF